MDYFKYTTKARLDKSTNTLLGILEGISADQTVSAAEWRLLGEWAEENQQHATRHPYNELVPALIKAMSDSNLSEEEHQNLVWLCRQLRSTEYYNAVTADMQRLQGMLAAIAADGVVTEAEVETLSAWLQEHEDLRTCWPFDEVDSLISAAMQDHWIDPVEQKGLLEYFQSFTPQDLNFSRPVPTNATLKGVCAVDPMIVFADHRFCFTGESARATREEMTALALKRGAKVLAGVSPRLDYLIVGSNGNPCWAYACYGRKIEKALELRKQGSHLLIVHEADFFDATA